MKKIFILFLLFALSACVQLNNQKDRIINKELTLIVDNRLPNQTKLPYILIKADGRISGSTGCNRILGTASFGELPGEVIFEHVATTKMFCFNNNDLENYFVKGLNQTLYYNIVADTLYLLDKDKQVIFSLKIKQDY